MTRKLLSRDDILAIYNPSGKDTLQLLGGSAHHSTKVIETGVVPPATEGGFRSSQVPGVGGSDKPRSGRPAVILPGTGLHAANRQGQDPSRQDALTGLCSRSHFRGRCSETLAQARDAGRQIALVLMGLDRFKDLNNTLGYKVGDEVLVDVAQNLKSLLNSNDTIGRFGGDEFALLLTSISNKNDVTTVAGKLLESTARIMRRYMPGLRSGASLGVARFPEHGADVDELIQNADIALHRAKAEGRGQVQMYEPHMRVTALGRLEQLAAFQRAVESGEIKPFYQPQMRLSDRRSYGFEALARWLRPNGEMLYPAQFKAALEDPDTAILLGEHMLQSVSHDLERWRLAGMPHCKVSVNATAPELKRGDYPDKVARLLSSKRIPFSQLTVEVTESVLLDDKGADITQTISDLRRLGVSVALDDFGTGFASLTHLKSFAVDQIKIDRSFIVHLTSNANDRTIVRATLGLAKSLGMQTVAEGLENIAQLKCLQMFGCDFGQGFFFSPAMPVERAETYFRAHRAYQKAQLHQFVLQGEQELKWG